MIPGSTAPEPKSTNTDQRSLRNKFKSTCTLKGSQQYLLGDAIFLRVFLALGLAAFSSFNYLH